MAAVLMKVVSLAWTARYPREALGGCNTCWAGGEESPSRRGGLEGGRGGGSPGGVAALHRTAGRRAGRPAGWEGLAEVHIYQDFTPRQRHLPGLSCRILPIWPLVL